MNKEVYTIGHYAIIHSATMGRSLVLVTDISDDGLEVQYIKPIDNNLWHYTSNPKTFVPNKILKSNKFIYLGEDYEHSLKTVDLLYG